MCVFVWHIVRNTHRWQSGGC